MFSSGPSDHASRTLPLDRRTFLAMAVALLADAGALAQGSAGRASSHADRSPGSSLLPQFPLTQPSADSFAALMAYDPAHDPDAPFFRSFTPRAPRIAPFAATQAHPSLDPRPRVAGLSTCYSTLAQAADSESCHRHRYGTPPEGGVYVSRFFTYHDILVQWSGTGQIPNPAMTDVAHRNGACCLGTIFQPDHRVYDSSTVPAQKVAAKFAELAAYFGFDGYFFNFEDGTPAANAQVLTLIGLMREEAQALGLTDFQVQFYDGHTDMDGLFPVHGTAGQSYATSTMLDQGWSAYGGPGHCCSGEPLQPSDVHRYCKDHGFDPFADAYFGLQLYPGPGYLDAVAPAVIHPNDGAYAYGSLQLYSVEDGLQNQLRADQPSLPLQTIQGELYALERRFFSGKSQNPALENRPDAAAALAYLPNRQVAERQSGQQQKTVARSYHFYTDRSAANPKPTDQINLPISYGVANFIVEHSVIGAFPFLTRFNLGEGRRFFLDGAPVSEKPWFNLGIQDLLPTWQWWVEPIAGTPVRDEHSAAQKLSADYDQETVFHGGASLRLGGMLQPGEGAQLHLYKTALKVSSGADLRLHLVNRHSSDASSSGAVAQLGLVFEDAPDKPEWVAIHNEEAMQQELLAGGWTRSTLDLGRFKGRTIAALLLGFLASETAAVIDMHLGEVYLGAPAPISRHPAPIGFTLEGQARNAEGNTAQARLRWHTELPRHPAHYDIFCIAPNAAERTWLGRIQADSFYAANVPLDQTGSVTFELTATYPEAPLMPSLPATITLKV